MRSTFLFALAPRTEASQHASSDRDAIWTLDGGQQGKWFHHHMIHAIAEISWIHVSHIGGFHASHHAIGSSQECSEGWNKQPNKHTHTHIWAQDEARPKKGSKATHSSAAEVQGGEVEHALGHLHVVFVRDAIAQVRTIDDLGDLLLDCCLLGCRFFGHARSTSLGWPFCA